MTSASGVWDASDRLKLVISTNINDDRKLATGAREDMRTVRNRSSNQFFVDLGEFSGYHDPTSPRHARSSSSVFADSVRSLVEHDRASGGLRLSNHSFRSFDLIGGKPEERERVGRKARDGQGRERCARPRNRLDPDARVDRCPESDDFRDRKSSACRRPTRARRSRRAAATDQSGSSSVVRCARGGWSSACECRSARADAPFDVCLPPR